MQHKLPSIEMRGDKMPEKVYYEDRKLTVSPSDVTIEGMSYDLSTIQDATIDKDDMNRHAFIGAVGAAAAVLGVLFGWLPVMVLALVAVAVGSIIFLPRYTVILSTPFGRIEAFTSVRRGNAEEVLEAITAAKDDLNRVRRYTRVGALTADDAN
jgi:hypothetical protein